MKMKQKLVILVVVFGLALGGSIMVFADSVLAQASRADEDALDFEEARRSDAANLAKCDDDSENCCGDVETSIIGGNFCDDDQEEGGVIFGLLKWVLRIMTAGVGVAAVGGVAYGALLYTTAENKPEQTKKAISVITNVVIGIVAYALMAVFLNFLIPGGVFS